MYKLKQCCIIVAEVRVERFSTIGAEKQLRGWMQELAPRSNTRKSIVQTLKEK